MNPLFEAVVAGGFLMDALGVVGLGLVSLSAIRLAQRRQSWGGATMAAGAAALLVARLIIVFGSYLRGSRLQEFFGDTFMRLVHVLPSLLLTIGLAAVVWGIWAHERWLRETR